MKRLKLLFAALALFTMSLSACGSKTKDVWTVSDGHLFHNDSDMGLVVGPQGEKGDQGDKGDTGEQGPKGDQGEVGPQGEKGDTGETGATGAAGAQGEKGDKGDKGDTGEQGPKGDQGEQGVAGNGIASVELSNDGYNDIHTLNFTDGSSYSFKTPNPATAIEIIHCRYGNDEFGDQIDLPYYVGASAPLDLAVTVTFATGDERGVENYTVEGFDTATAGKKDVTVKFGPVSDSFSVDVINIGDEVAEIEGLTDILPGLSAGAYDYSYAESLHALIIAISEDADVKGLIAQYQADLEAALFTYSSTDSYGDKHYLSPSGEYTVCAWNYHGYIRVDLLINEPFPLDAVNTFCETYELGFQLTDADATAFGRAPYQTETDTSNGYHYFLVAVMYVDCVAEWKAILEPTLEAAGFEWDDTYGFVNYSTYKQVSVAYDSEYDYTYIMFWQ